MGHRWQRLVVGVLAAAALVAAGGRARASTDGLVLRAFGFFEGTFQNGTCNVPNSSSGFVDAGTEMGLWNTFGIQTISFPDLGNPNARPCGGWIELTSALQNEGITVQYADINLRISGAGQFRQFVPTRNGFPSACRRLRKQRIFFPARLAPAGGDAGNTGSGQSNAVFAQLLPMVSAQVIECLREQYTGLPTTVYTSFPLVIRAVVVGQADDGSNFRSNPLQYTLTLRHLCGNGRTDDGEECDPNGPNTCGADHCDTTAHTCMISGAACAGDAQCAGVCVPQNDPSECTCEY
jgi:hypothetical protein